MYNYFIPKIGPYYPFYNLSLPLDLGSFSQCLLEGNIKLNITFNIFLDKKKIFNKTKKVLFDRNKNPLIPMISFNFKQNNNYNGVGFFEVNVETDDGKELIKNNALEFTSYCHYWSNERKGFITETPYKYSDPRIILQMEKFGEFIQSYSCIAIDVNRNYDESLIIINPFMQSVRLNIISQDKRILRNITVDKLSSRILRLSKFLKGKETSFNKSIQIFSKNRILLWTIKHLHNDVSNITDHEHLDWFQPSAAKIPFSLFLRRKLGDLIGYKNIGKLR